MSTNPDFDYSSYLGHNNPPNDVAEIKRLAKQQHELEQEVFQLELKLADAKEKLKNVSEHLLPEQMQQVGLTDLNTDDGFYIEVEEKTRGALPTENRPAGFQWLEDNGAGAIIKSYVCVPFSKKELELTKKLVEELKEKKRIATLEREVHWKTLDSFINERLEEGKDIPLDIFSIHHQRVAKVKIGKE